MVFFLIQTKDNRKKAKFKRETEKTCAGKSRTDGAAPRPEADASRAPAFSGGAAVHTAAVHPPEYAQSRQHGYHAAGSGAAPSSGSFRLFFCSVQVQNVICLKCHIQHNAIGARGSHFH